MSKPFLIGSSCVLLVSVLLIVLLDLDYNTRFVPAPNPPSARSELLNTDIVPGSAELLLRNSAYGGDIQTARHNINERLFDAGVETLTRDIKSVNEIMELPSGYYQIGYLPDELYIYGCSEFYYLTPDNLRFLHDFMPGDKPAEVTAGTMAENMFNLFAASMPYEKQVKSSLLMLFTDPLYESAGTVSNLLVQSGALRFDNKKTFKKDFVAAFNGGVSKCTITEYQSPHFDAAYIAEVKPRGDKRDYVYFVSTRVLDTPIQAYDFNLSDTWLTEDNINDCLVTYDTIRLIIHLSSVYVWEEDEHLFSKNSLKEMMYDILDSIGSAL